MAGYDYVRRMYRVEPRAGMRVRHTVTKRLGTIVPERSPSQYVQVRFDGQTHALPCHPRELDYAPVEGASQDD